MVYHLRAYNSNHSVTFGTTQVHISRVRPVPHNQGQPNARTFRPSLPLGSVWLPAHPYYHPECTLLQSGVRPELSYSASWSEWVIWPAKWEECVQNDKRASNNAFLNRHRRNHMSQPTHRLCPTPSYITPWFYSMIANIANRDQVSTYIAGDRKSPTYTDLSMAKHRMSYSY